MNTLEPGSAAPAISLPTDTGETFALGAQAGKRVLIYFYPQADTPACTSQNEDFSRLASDFERLGIVLVGISPDSPEKLRAFRAKYGLTTILASDPDKTVIAAYGAWGEKINYGRTYTGLIRTSVLVDADGRVAQVWPNIRAKGHADRVLKALSAA